jgi:hypothetical protein
MDLLFTNLKFMKNEGLFDRAMRAVLAVIFFLVGFYVLSGILSIIVYVLGVAMLITAITGFCYLYKLLGIDTNK